MGRPTKPPERTPGGYTSAELPDSKIRPPWWNAPWPDDDAALVAARRTGWAWTAERHRWLDAHAPWITSHDLFSELHRRFPIPTQTRKSR